MLTFVSLDGVMQLQAAQEKTPQAAFSMVVGPFLIGMNF